ncbi:MAG: TCR/Tet family MFS transporter [Candidatus Eremiobacteraeota bacterium]|nr:TCR/Tet family MFS transporter [Candidatus Eremiobacteraeota bacterium]MBV8721342.1 TCR/Tet family MFS transporter [Candidatus Eremiobacteraeota bacterium]
MQQPNGSPRNAAIVFIFITIAIDMIALGIIAPVLPRLIANFLHGDLSRAAEITGIFTTVWAAMQFFCSPLLGMLSDRVGRRPVILISCAVTAVDFAIMAVAPNLWWLFAGRVLSGMATANLTTAYAYIADVTAHEKRAQAYGLLSAAFGLGFIIGPAIGGLAGNHDPRLPFWIAAGLSVANTLYGFFVLPESLKGEHRTKAVDWRRANPVGSLKLLRRHRELYGLATTTFIALVAHEALPVLWVLYLIAQFGWDTRAIGLTLALVGVCSAVTAATLVGPVVKALGERRTMVLGLVTFCLGNVLLGVNSAPVFIAGVIVLCVSIYNSPMQSLMSKRVGPSEQGELQGALGSLRGIAMMIGPGIFAWSFAQVSGPWRSLDVLGAPFWLAAAMLVVAIALAWRVTTREDDVVLPLPEPAPVTMVEG